MAKERTISEDIKAAEEAEKVKAQEAEKETEGTEAPPEGEEDMAKATKWGSFKVETGIVPERATAGTSKYDWASFPAPTNPEDSSTWPSVFIPDIGGKTIYTSIKKFRDKEQKEGRKAPEFTVSVSKDPKGVRVIRKS